MFLYKKDMYDSFRFKFPSLENISQSYSQAMQDMFVLAVLRGKHSGSFLEIGAFEPVFISNTYLLESQYSWRGISVDKDPNFREQFSNMGRTAKFIVNDALSVKYSEVISSEGFGNRLDYLSLDIEPNIQTLTCLKMLPLDKFRFSVITFETDFYDTNTDKKISEEVRKESRSILDSLGYTLVAGNLSNITNDAPFEDWYLDSTFFDKKTIDLFKRDNDSPLAAHKYMLKVNNE